MQALWANYNYEIDVLAWQSFSPDDSAFSKILRRCLPFASTRRSW